jgi:UPF0755 protein
MRRALVTVLAIAVLAVLGLAVYQRWVDRALHAEGPHAANVPLTVAPGSSVRAVLDDLERKGALRDARAVVLHLRARNRNVAVKAGEYLIPARASAEEILEQLSAGRVILETLTVVEGWTFADMRRAVESHPRVRATFRGRSDAEIMQALGRPGEHPEGRFHPDTYRFAAGTTDLEVYRLAYEALERILASAWKERAEDLPLRTPYEALTLASIVEKETGLPSERPRIAGVFVSRLRRGMRLQSDPTVIYGLGARYDGDIRNRDLVTETPYNTYTRGGLTPTPIALPGRDAIVAVMRPLVTGELYFVATGEGNGAHYFSYTLEEHNAAVKRYLARLRGARGASGDGR